MTQPFGGFLQKHKPAIKQQQIVDFYIKLQTKISKKTHKPYSQSVIAMIHDVFYSVMKYGRDSLGIHCILPEFFHVRRDFDEEKPVLFFLDDEIGKLIKRIYDMKGRGNLFLKLGILMALFHGLRIGEFCGLRWEDIDFGHQQMHIRRTASYCYDPINKKQTILVRKPKTKSSNRTIRINDSVFEVLKFLKSKNFYSGYLIRNSKDFNIPDVAIPCSDKVLRQKLSRTLKQAGISPHRFHCLRHTFASHAISLGKNPKTVSVILGHASVDFTLNVYVHPSEEELAECVNLWQLNMVKLLHLKDYDTPEEEDEELLLEEIDLHENAE